MKEKLQTLLRTLNAIDVRGEGNLDRLLASIRFIQGMIGDLDAPAKEEVKNP